MTSEFERLDERLVSYKLSLQAQPVDDGLAENRGGWAGGFRLATQE